MVYALILLPLAMAAAAFALPSDRMRPWLLPVGALAELALVGWAVAGSRGGPFVAGLGGWLQLDPLGQLVLGYLGLLFFLCSLYVPGYLAPRLDRSNRIFCANL